MGLLCDYFAAPSDASAAATIDRDGGPGSLPAPPPPQRRSVLFRRRLVSDDDPGSVEVYPTVELSGIDPVVQMGTLEALLTGRTYDDVVEAQSADPVIAVRNEGERLVVKLSDGLAVALASASDDDLVRVADPWSKTEEFWGGGDPVMLAAVLREMAGLARAAVSRNHSLYCWLSL